jgi:cell division protein FtsL
MKKGNKPAIILFFAFILSIAAIAFLIVSTTVRYKALTKEKDHLEKMINNENTLRDKLLADFQMISSEEEIIKIANKELGMVKRTAGDPLGRITIDSKRIEEVNLHLKEKYD